MSYQIIPNIVFIFAILGILLLILRRLPEAAASDQQIQPEPEARQRLLEKGLPAQAISKLRVATVSVTKRIWNFALEAKDLKPTAATGYRMKKIFGGKLPSFKKTPIIAPITTHDVKSEQFYLDNIKLEPKNLSHYDALGKFYLEQENVADASDIYAYLVNHQPSNPEYQARLAYCCYRSGQFPKAVEHYQKSVNLDSTQPNRYYNLALSQEAAGSLEDAIKTLEHAIALEPAIKYYIALSNAYVKTGNAQKARAALLTAKKQDPENEQVLAKLEKIR